MEGGQRVLSKFVIRPGAFRIALALAVLLSHISAVQVGRLGVMLFFFLSGYWVLDIWKGRFGRDRLLRFYASRYFRIVPLYALTVLVGILVIGTDTLRPEVATLIGLASRQDSDLTGVAWTLDIELQFYLLLPFAALLLDRFRGPLLVLACIPLMVLGWILQFQFGLVTVACYALPFALGMLSRQHRPEVSDKVAFYSAAAFIGSIALLMLTGFGSAMLNKHVPDPIPEDIFAMIIMLPLLPYVIASLRRRSDGLDRHLGDLTYALYLTHFLVLRLVAPTNVIEKGWAVLLVFVVALAAYLLFDRPMERFRRRYIDGTTLKSPAVLRA